MNRKQIAAELIKDCPKESKKDHQEIADAILAGKSFDEICSTTAIDEWPETYVWVKNELAINAAAAALGSIKSDKKTASSRENGKKGGRPKSIAKRIVEESANAGEAMDKATKYKSEVDQDWKNETTTYTFSDKSVLIVNNMDFKVGGRK